MAWNRNKARNNKHSLLLMLQKTRSHQHPASLRLKFPHQKSNPDLHVMAECRRRRCGSGKVQTQSAARLNNYYDYDYNNSYSIDPLHSFSAARLRTCSLKTKYNASMTPMPLRPVPAYHAPLYPRSTSSLLRFTCLYHFRISSSSSSRAKLKYEVSRQARYCQDMSQRSRDINAGKGSLTPLPCRQSPIQSRSSSSLSCSPTMLQDLDVL